LKKEAFKATIKALIIKIIISICDKPFGCKLKNQQTLKAVNSNNTTTGYLENGGYLVLIY
jgi:hypothetical protein